MIAMSFNPEAVRAGNIAKKEAEEFPTTFGTANGSDFSAPSQNLDKANQTRMAGPGGAFAMKMMQDPQLQERVLQWNQRFMQSNQGMEFNKAQMGMMAAAGQVRQLNLNNSNSNSSKNLHKKNKSHNNKKEQSDGCRKVCI